MQLRWLFIFNSHKWRISFFTVLVILIAVPLLSRQSGTARGEESNPDARIQAYFQKWKQAAQEETLDPPRRKAIYLSYIRELFALNNLSRTLLSKRWAELSPVMKDRFSDALATAIVEEILAAPAMQKLTGGSKLLLVKNKVDGLNATLDYQLTGSPEKKNIRVFLVRDARGVWNITNLKFGKKSLMRHYYKYCHDLLDDYSLPYLIAELSKSGYVVLEDFEDSTPGQLPRGWGWKKKDNEKRKPYRVEIENGNKYLAATDRGESVILGKKIKWNLKKYRYVSFRWRAHRLPEGGDERYGKTVDSAAGIYFTYKKKLGLIPVSVKFVWSTTLPVGSAMLRNGIGKPWMVVAESGADHLGEWRTYVFDLYQAYRDTFGGDPPDTAIGIGILSDANSTHSFAYADYDDIRALKTAQADSGVKKILDAE